MKLINGNEYELSTGKTFSANNGILGINPKLNGIADGCDGWVCYNIPTDEDDPEYNQFTSAELIEIADFMIELWGKLKEKVRKE